MEEIMKAKKSLLISKDINQRRDLWRCTLWDKLVEENAPLRAVISNRLVSVPDVT